MRYLFLLVYFTIPWLAFCEAGFLTNINNNPNQSSPKITFWSGVGLNNSIFFNKKYSIDSSYNSDFVTFTNVFHFRYITRVSPELIGLVDFPIYKKYFSFQT